MPSTTLTVAADVTTVSSPAYGAGAGNHLPVGTWSSWKYRAALRFNKPSWTTWTEITKATLSFYISDHYHVGVVNGSFYCRRTGSTPWTASEGSSTCESMGSANTTQYDDLVPVSTDQVSWSSGTTANAKKSLTVTNLVKWYFANNQNIVFVLDQVDSSDYTELWSRNTSYDATLTIEYVVQSVPNAPALVSPAANESVASETPTFSWTHSDAQNDPQTAAEVELSNFAGTVLNTYPVTGSGSSLVCPDVLNRGSGYKYRVRTSDAGGWGAWSALRDFTIRNLPTVTINPTREMVFANGAPRLVVRWTCDQSQQKYRVRTDTFDSGWITGTAQSYTLSTYALTDNVTVPVYVDVEAADALQGTGFRNITPRYGLTTQKKDLGEVPLSWLTPTISSDVPAGCSLVVEYGSNSSDVSIPSAWYSSLSAVPRAQYLFYRVWFIPSATQSPTLYSIVIPTSNTVNLIDHWYIWHGQAFGPPWEVDTGEYVYGTRSVSVTPAATNAMLHSELMKLRAGRSYILTGLMKSQGNSGARFQLIRSDGSGLFNSQGQEIISEKLTETRDWFKPDELDTYRYRTPIYVAPSDMDVYVFVRADGGIADSRYYDADQGGIEDLSAGSAYCQNWGYDPGAGGIPPSGYGTYFYAVEMIDTAGWITHQTPIAAKAGDTLKGTTLFYGPPGRLQIAYYNAAGAWLQTTSHGPVAGNYAWTWYEINATVPNDPNIAQARLVLQEFGTVGWMGFDEHRLVNIDTGVKAWFDAIKLEESSVATPWSPGAVGASIVDAGGVQVDGQRGAVLRYRGRDGGLRSVIEGGAKGLDFGGGGDVELHSPYSGTLAVNERVIPLRSTLGNLFNGDFEQGDTGGWYSQPTGQVESLTSGTGWQDQGWEGNWVHTFHTANGDGNAFLQHNDLIPVYAGQVISLSAQVGYISGQTGTVRLMPIMCDKNGAEIQYPSWDFNVGPTPTLIGYPTFTVPVGANFIRLRIVPYVAGVYLAVGFVRIIDQTVPRQLLIAGPGASTSVGAGWTRLPLAATAIEGDATLLSGGDVVIREAGLYQIHMTCAGSGGTKGDVRMFRIYKNGGPPNGHMGVTGYSVGGSTGQYYEPIFLGVLTPGDVISVYAYATGTASSYNAGVNVVKLT